MLIDGKSVAERIRKEIAQEVQQLLQAGKPRPGLATVLIGENAASQSYVRSKRKACAEVGFTSFAHELPANVSQEEVETLVNDLNNNPEVHGILIQLPLPDHLDEKRILDLVKFDKDVDGFHPMNVGMLAMKGREPKFVSCTPQGVMELLKETGVQLSGAQAVVLGRSNIVGMPVALLLMHANATVTIAHSRTRDLPAVCRSADVLIAAVGRAEMVTGDWVKPGAVVIDVGINRVDDAAAKNGYRLVGDVHTASVEKVASAVTPVPGGVGPLTIAMLLKNTLRAAQQEN